MSRSTADLRADAVRIWHAGVAAVRPERLLPVHLHIDGRWLRIDDAAFDLRGVERIAIVGAGKAAGAMAAALESALGPRLLKEHEVTGWVNVPADCLVSTRCVHLHAARPAGINEPRPEGVAGTNRILDIVSSLSAADLCFCLLTGGGSALLPAPVSGVSLDDEIRLTRLLSAAGANIKQLNTLRREVSLVKGGGLAQACHAGRLITLLISDVLGDPLEVIASGPTVPSPTTAADALAVLDDLRLATEPTIEPIVRYLRQGGRQQTASPETRISHFLLGNNATAVKAAGVEAERIGYSPAMTAANEPEGPADDVGRHLAEMALRMRSASQPDCLVSGGEPTVTLVEECRRGLGGRNQQLALAALGALGDCREIALLSAGTDGEDGPTDAAGAVVTSEVVRAASERRLDPGDYLARNDAYHFFQQAGGLLITGPTQTNVCDLRVIVTASRTDRATGAV